MIAVKNCCYFRENDLCCVEISNQHQNPATYNQ